MKVMIKGLAKDEMTLNKLGVVKGSKVMVVGSSLNDVLQVSSSPKEASKAGNSSNSSKEEPSSSKMKNHKKVLDRGKPDDAMPARKSGKDPLPQQPLSGMLNKHGGKVRLTFKMDQGQVWIGKYENDLLYAIRLCYIKVITNYLITWGAELGPPGFPGGPHLFGFYKVKI